VSVYVDAIFYCHPRDPAVARYGNAWCHLWADDVEELNAFAKRMSLNPSWFQDRAKFPHFDLTARMRERAIVFGAVETTWKVWIERQAKR